MDMPRTNFLRKRGLLFAICGFFAISFADLSMNSDASSNEDIDQIYILRKDVKKEEPKENETATLIRYQEECKNITNVEESLVKKLKKGFWGINDRSIKRWAFCILKKRGFMTKHAVFRVDVAMSKIPDCDKEKAEIILDKCLSSKENPPLEAAWMYLKCLSVRDPKRNLSLGIFPRTTTDRYHLS